MVVALKDENRFRRNIATVPIRFGQEMESNIPPLLCCIGESVSGQPTHFMMERAFTAQELDWRVLSIQVPLENLAQALTGARVMGFNALRFTGEWCNAIGHVASNGHSALGSNEGGERQSNADTHKTAIECTASTRLIGSLTSAKLTPTGFTGWHNAGPGLLHTIQAQSLELNSLLFWMHEDTTWTRSIFAALQDREYLQAIWTMAPLAYVDRKLASPRTTITVEHSFQSAELPSSASEIVYVGPIDESTIGLLSELATEKTVFCVATNDNVDADLDRQNFSQIDASELSVAAEAYDFRNWTGSRADPAVLRDAYDEYCDF